MAITSGAGPHYAWITVNGASFPVEHGSVQQQGSRKSSSFSVAVPLSYPGAEAFFATVADNTAVVSVVTRGMEGPLLTGEVDSAAFDYVGRLIRITGRDKAAKLHENMTSEKWLNKKGDEIVKELAGRVGLDVSGGASTLMAGKMLEKDYVRLSDNVSFAYVIHKIAEMDGARWWVDPYGVLNYALFGNPAGIYSLNYVAPTEANPMVADFMQLRVCRDIQAGKTAEVTVKSWHPKDKRVYENTATIGGSGGPRKFNYHLPNLKQDHVERHAKSRANEAARHELRVDATIVGDPTINVAMGLRLNGTGFFDQVYEMDCVHHEIGMSGHSTHITARSAKAGRQAS